MSDLGASASRPGSREPSPDGLGPTGFDPSRGPTRGEQGYYRLLEKFYPARCIETGVRQSSGPVDEIIIYTKYGWRDVVTRTSGGYNSCDGGQWLSAAQYREIELERISEVLAGAQARLAALRDSDGSPKGGDACGSVHDSAGRQASPNA